MGGGGWVGAAGSFCSWVGAAAAMYLEVSARHCCVIADPHLMTPQGGCLEEVSEQGHLYISVGHQVPPPGKGY